MHQMMQSRSLILILFFAISCTLQEKHTPRQIPPRVIAILNDTADFVFNKDYSKRDKLLGINIDWNKDRGEIEYFENLTVEQLDQLLIGKFIDPGEYQNLSPTVKTFYEFMSKFPAVTAHGYAVVPTGATTG
jgi:hypothetical protein